MVRVAVVNAHARRRVRSERLMKAVRLVLRGEKAADADISIICIDHRRCRTINRKYLRHDRTTDVISFTLESTPVLEGEVYVNLDQATTQAKFFGATVRDEIARLVIHGTLHLLGYDDRTPGDRRVMKEKEETYLAKCGAKRVL